MVGVRGEAAVWMGGGGGQRRRRETLGSHLSRDGGGEAERAGSCLFGALGTRWQANVNLLQIEGFSNGICFISSTNSVELSEGSATHPLDDKPIKPANRGPDKPECWICYYGTQVQIVRHT